MSQAGSTPSSLTRGFVAVCFTGLSSSVCIPPHFVILLSPCVLNQGQAAAVQLAARAARSRGDLYNRPRQNANGTKNQRETIMAFQRRTHTCGELRESHVGQTVILNGWVNTYRSQQYQVFVDLRDRYGLTQVVFEAEGNADLFATAGEIRSEWVLQVRGKVRERLPGKHNPKLPTGDVEVEVHELTVLNRCPNPPFEVWSVPQDDRALGDPELANEDLRLQYRYLDLRRPTLQRTLQMRHRLNKVIRDFLDAEGFLEIETPLLGRSTPEGA